jgi:hypothetical protein
MALSSRRPGSAGFAKGSIWVPRGNGKSSLVWVLALYTTFLEDEGGAEGYTAAVSRDQAKIVFDLAKAMTQRNPGFRREFGISVREHAILQLASASRLMAISSDAKAFDGLNVHFAVLDEIASHRSKAVYDVIITYQQGPAAARDDNLDRDGQCDGDRQRALGLQREGPQRARRRAIFRRHVRCFAGAGSRPGAFCPPGPVYKHVDRSEPLAVVGIGTDTGGRFASEQRFTGSSALSRRGDAFPAMVRHRRRRHLIRSAPWPTGLHAAR